MDGQTYAFQDAKIRLKGIDIAGATKFSYKKSQGTANIYGLNRDPVRFTRGKNSYEGSITLLQYELEKLIEISPVKDLCMLDFEVVFSYELPDGQVTTDVATFCRVTEFEKGFGQDDDMMEIELPLAIGKIKYNVFYSAI